MARSINRVTLLGNVGGDPEIRVTQSGAKVAQLSLATSHHWTDKDGQRHENTQWHRCVLWNTKHAGLADVAENYIKKGDKIHVDGSIDYRQWEDNNGTTRYSTEIKVRELVLLGAPAKGQQTSSAPQRERATPAPARTEPAARTEASDNFDDFPGALQDEDDDLPF